MGITEDGKKPGEIGGKILRIIFSKGRIEALDYFTDQMMAACDRLCIDHYLVDLNDPGTFRNEAFISMLEREECVAFFFNQVGLGIMMDGQNMWDRYEIPVYDFVQDHPRNFDDWFDAPIKNLHAIVLDRNHEKFIRRFYPNIDDIIFMPNGGNEVGEHMAYQDRPIDVLYMGSCQQRVNTFPVIDFLSDGGNHFFSSTINTLAKYPELTTEDIIDVYIEQNALNLTDEQIRSLHIDYAMYVEVPIRRHFKLMGMRALSEAGVNVEVYGGSDWIADDYEYGENIHIHERISSEECNRMAAKSKICLNFMPWYKDGCSERAFNGMINGAITLSDRSTYLEENYEDGRNIVYFDLLNPEQMVMDVQWLLSHEEEAARIAEAGYVKAKENDSWDSRMRFFLRQMGVDL